MVFKPNDRYPLTKDVFRLYYTSLSSDRQTIDVYVEDSFGKVQQLTFSFNNEREEGKVMLRRGSFLAVFLPSSQ